MMFQRFLVLTMACCGVVGIAADATSRSESAPALAELSRLAGVGLRENILPFWLQHARDRRAGGFHGGVGADLSIQEQLPRGSLLTSRILWTFSAAHREAADPAYLEMARWAFDDLLARFWDEEKGGFYWSTQADGTPLDTRKHLYGQAFAIYGLTEYHRATGDVEAREIAIALYRAMERYGRDPRHGGYFEELDRAWQRRENVDPRERLLGGTGPKSQNAHLHIMEAYTNLLRVWPDAQLREDLRALVDVLISRVVDPDTHHLHLFLDDDWTPRSDTNSYGHDIEFSWLLTETADLLGDDALRERARTVALAVADACLREGSDDDGGMFNEGGPAGVVDKNKDWWPQAEAVVGFLNAWQLSQEPRYLAAAEKTWAFIERTLVNREGGEWYRATNRAGRPDKRSPLAGMWKCPYHNSRACLEVIARTRVVPATLSAWAQP